MKKILPVIILLIIIAGAAYWYFFMRTPSTGVPANTDQGQGGFAPFGRGPTGTGSQNNSGGFVDTPATSTTGSTIEIPVLRLLSDTPVGGYGASTTASTTIIRWADRGRGNIYEAHSDIVDIETISNTIVPKIYESVWNKNVTAFIASTFNDAEKRVDIVYADIKARILPKVATTTTVSGKSASSTSATSTSTNTSTLPPIIATPTQSLTPYELKGKNLPENIIAYTASPKKDKLFMLVKDANNGGIGYISTFDGKAVTQLFITPLTQVRVEWPEEKTIAVTTIGNAEQGGYLYFVDAKTGIWKKILGPVAGMSTKVSTDAKRVIVSTTSNAKNILTSVYTVSEKRGTDAIIQTLADKCVWGNFYKEMVYCAAPSQLVEGTYPDDWYAGTLSTIDKIWQINGSTGEIKLISSIVDTSDRVIDAFNLGLDAKDNFLFFMNKNDLSLWSLDLVSSN